MLIRTDTRQPWRGEPLLNLDPATHETVGRNIRYPTNIEQVWSPEELAAVGLVIAVPMEMPDGHRRAGPSTWDASGHESFPTEEIPPRTQQGIDEFRDRTTARLDATEGELRALLGIILDEFNRHSAVHREIIRAVADATSLANLQSRVAFYVAAIPDGLNAGVPARSFADLRMAFRNKLGS